MPRCFRWVDWHFLRVGGRGDLDTFVFSRMQVCTLGLEEELSGRTLACPTFHPQHRKQSCHSGGVNGVLQRCKGLEVGSWGHWAKNHLNIVTLLLSEWVYCL